MAVVQVFVEGFSVWFVFLSQFERFQLSVMFLEFWPIVLNQKFLSIVRFKNVKNIKRNMTEKKKFISKDAISDESKTHWDKFVECHGKYYDEN